MIEIISNMDYETKGLFFFVCCPVLVGFIVLIGAICILIFNRYLAPYFSDITKWTLIDTLNLNKDSMFDGMRFVTIEKYKKNNRIKILHPHDPQFEYKHCELYKNFCNK